MRDTDISKVPMLDRCTDRQLRDLLALASTDEKVKRNWLLEIDDLEQMESLLTEMCSGSEQSPGALLQAVRSQDTSLEVLVAIKRMAKRLAVAADAARQNAAATLLYHLAVASALGHHGQNISSKDPTERVALYKDLAAQLFDEELAAIFEKAVAKILA